jgi:hypothetical protein
MVNNFYGRKVLKLAPFFFLFFLNELSAQKISKYYTSSLQSNGTLYFIFEQSGFKSGSDDFLYDITYLSTAENATFNFSYFDKAEYEFEKIGWVIKADTLVLPLKKIFIETKKNKWHYRYSAYPVFSMLTNFFNQSEPPAIILFSKKNNISLCIAKSKWKKTSSITKKIFTLINHNK